MSTIYLGILHEEIFNLLLSLLFGINSWKHTATVIFAMLILGHQRTINAQKLDKKEHSYLWESGWSEGTVLYLQFGLGWDSVLLGLAVIQLWISLSCDWWHKVMIFLHTLKCCWHVRSTESRCQGLAFSGPAMFLAPVVHLDWSEVLNFTFGPRS